MEAQQPGDEIVVLTHLPLVQIGEDSVPFLGGDLWRMPFENFDALTAGAFCSHAAAYRAVSPVFLRFTLMRQRPNVVPLNLAQQGESFLQTKFTRDYLSPLGDLGLGVLARVHAFGAHPSWLALVLQAPGAILPSPSWSLAIAVADPGFGFASAGGVSRVLSAQGKADLEYLINQGFPVTRFDSEALRAASAWAERIATEKIDGALWPALEALGISASPLLGPEDRTVTATVALESLLLPEVRSGMSATLERRLGHLLGRDDAERQVARNSARLLYNRRSTSVHGRALSPTDAAIAVDGAAWLTAAICALDQCCTAQRIAVPEVLAGLDKHALGGSLPATEKRTHTSALIRAHVSAVGLPITNLGSPDGVWLLWAPLPGLLSREPLCLDGRIDSSCWRMILSLSGHELLTLEERDIARDFAGKLRMIDDEIAALFIVIHNAPDDQVAALGLLQRERELAVAALRLAGLHDFCDPALAGLIAMKGNVRLRQPCVLRQSVWQLIEKKRSTAAELTAKNANDLALAWKVLDAYRRAGGHPDLDRALSLLLRGFYRQFAASHVCVGLHYAVIEALLGRFRSPADPLQLETLVELLLDEKDASATWFRIEGRAVRNAVAHGRASEEVCSTAINPLATIAVAAWRRAAQIHTKEPATTHPGKRLIGELVRC